MYTAQLKSYWFLILILMLNTWYLIPRIKFTVTTRNRQSHKRILKNGNPTFSFSLKDHISPQTEGTLVVPCRPWYLSGYW